MTRGRVLVIDDEPAMLDNVCRMLGHEGYECTSLSEPQRARATLNALEPDVLLVDLMMPGVDGMTVLTVALADDPHRPVIVITGHATVQSAVRAMREGAFDYLAKPFTGAQLLVAVDRAMRYRSLVVENRALRARVEGLGEREGLVGSSPQLVRLLDQTRKVAPTDANVLITGESGTGKELVARCVHTWGPRVGRPFVAVDCASLPEPLLESELFGHERGAFTGAVARRDGLLAEANHGTVFLDEVAEMTPTLQAKLLRVLEQREVRRLGDSRVTALDIRVVAATNADLEAAVRAGAFRQDLYYRLNVVHLALPPLRERAGDIALLGQAFLVHFAEEAGKPVPHVSPDVWEALERYDWPGNVRELKNLVQRLVVLDDDGRVAMADLPENVRQGPLSPGGPVVVPAPMFSAGQSEALRSFRGAYLQRLLAQHGGNVTRAAVSAGVSRRTLHRWIADAERHGAMPQTS